MVHPQIDRDKVRAAIRRLGEDSVYCLLFRAVDLLPGAELLNLVEGYIDPPTLWQDGEDAQLDPLAAAKAFEKASLAGEYFESFEVNSKNHTQKSAGTKAWIAEHSRLLDQCVAKEKETDPSVLGQAFDILFRLLDNIDECRDGFVSFADEGGAWQVGVDWNKVLPVWFRVLSATAEPQEYASRIVRLLKHHFGHGSEKMLAIARKTATPAQREALPG